MPYKNLEITTNNYNIQHRSVRNHFYKGFSTADPTNYGSKLFDFDLIKQDILNHFNTRKGERVMNPTFGTIIWDLIMEPLTPQIKELLTQDVTTICTFDPRVNPIQIKINEYDQGYLIEVTLEMKNTDERSTLKLAFDQALGLRAQ
jgi:phage baseplate assembly protein W